MPERERPEYVIASAQALLAGAVVCALASLVAYLTGDVVPTRGGTFRTHVDAVWVLGALAVTMLVAAYLLANEHNRRS